MTTETSGANLLPSQSGLPQHTQPDEWEPITSSRWWRDLPEGISARRARRSERADRARCLREVDHLTAHPGIPANLIEALQHGTDEGDPLTETVVTIDGQRIYVAVSSRGTGIPEPDSQGVWDGLCDTVRSISALPYCADVVMPLPQEIAAIGWATAGGQTVNVTPCKTTRLRGVLSVALFPLARAGEVLTLSAATTSSAAAAALILGTSSLSPVPLPAEPAPALRPKVGVAQRIPQVATTLRPAPAKAQVRSSPPAKVAVKVMTRTSAPRPATPPTTTSTPRPATTPTRTAQPKPAPPSLSPAPTKQAATTPKAPETAHPTAPARPTEAGLETLLPSLTSILRGSRP